MIPHISSTPGLLSNNAHTSTDFRFFLFCSWSLSITWLATYWWLKPFTQFPSSLHLVSLIHQGKAVPLIPRLPYPFLSNPTLFNHKVVSTSSQELYCTGNIRYWWQRIIDDLFRKLGSLQETPQHSVLSTLISFIEHLSQDNDDNPFKGIVKFSHISKRVDIVTSIFSRRGNGLMTLNDIRHIANRPIQMGGSLTL